MRPIKFRALDKTTKKMINFEFESSADDYNVLRIHECGGEAHFAVEVNTERKTSYLPQHNFELMQFTGLYDIHKKEIYEGDIIRYRHNITSTRIPAETLTYYTDIVVYYDGAFRLKNDLYDWWLTKEMINDTALEVIGNKFEKEMRR